MYIFKWVLGQPFPSNLSKLVILNLGGALTCGREKENGSSWHHPSIETFEIVVPFDPSAPSILESGGIFSFELLTQSVELFMKFGLAYHQSIEQFMEVGHGLI